MKKFFKSLVGFVSHALYVGVIGVVAVIAGCSYLTPTVVPPMTKKLGYEVPHVKVKVGKAEVDVTVAGAVEGAYKLEVEKMKLWKYTTDATLEATNNARSQFLDWMTVLGLGGTACLPAALRSKTFVKE